jgi:hypothetical protein
MSLNNEFLQKQIQNKNLYSLPDNVKKSLAKEFAAMLKIGISNETDQDKYLFIRDQVPNICLSVFGEKVNEDVANVIASDVYQDNIDLSNGLQMIKATESALNRRFKKVAYPQGNPIYHKHPYNINKWVEATRQIYDYMSKGMLANDAKKSVIGEWQMSEQTDYESWLRNYQEGEKYKIAQYDSAIPMSILNARLPKPTPRFDEFPPAREIPGTVQQLPHKDVADVRETIEQQRKRIVARLTAAENILVSTEGQLFAGDDLELMLKLLHDLKRRVQTANKKTVKSSLFEDYIYKTANYLKFIKKDKQAGLFYRIAQMADPFGADMGGEEEEDESPGFDTGDTEGTRKALEKVFSILDTGVSDEGKTEDVLEEVKDDVAPPADAGADAGGDMSGGAAAAPIFTGASSKEELVKIGNGFYVTAQGLPMPAARPSPIEPIEPIAPRERPEATEEAPSDNTDDVIEAALRNVSIEDVIRRLEMLVSIYNKREIARQLSILDIMMDRIGLASYFPALGEAMSKSLESNQYIGSRLEDVLTKLKGSLNVPGASEWVEPTISAPPQTAQIRQNLAQKEREEQERKENRKKNELEKMNRKKEDLTEEFSQPSRIENSPRIDVR